MLLEKEIKGLLDKYDLYGVQFSMTHQGQTVSLISESKANTLKEDSLIRVASLSKMIVAIATLQLYEQAKIDLDTDISAYLGYPVVNPHYKDDKITTAMLLAHTSTIKDHPRYIVPFDEDIKEMFSPGGKYYNELPFTKIDDSYTAPGTMFFYSNANYMLLATIIEKVSGIRFDNYVQTHVFTPLNMIAAFNINQFDDTNFNLIHPINQKFETYKNMADIDLKRTEVKGYTIGQNGCLFGPQGSMRTNAKQLLKLMDFLLHGNESVLKDETRQLLLNTYKEEAMIPNDPRYTYSRGLGTGIITNKKTGRILVGHIGIAYGMEGCFYVNKQNDYGFSLLTIGRDQNRSKYEVDNSLFLNFQREVLLLVDNIVYTL